MSIQDPTKARLLTAAGEEFAEKGFEGATVRSICARADANLAAVNYHFGDKEQLYIQAVIEAHRCGVAMVSDEEFFRGGPEDQLRRFIRHFLANVLAIDTQEDWHYRLLQREMTEPTSASETLVREIIRPKFERLLTVLTALCPGLEGPKLHATAFSVIGQCLHYRLSRPITRRLIGAAAFAELDVEFLTDHITSVTLAALEAGRRASTTQPSAPGEPAP